MTTRGERLAAYLNAQTGGKYGWQKQLVAKSGVKRQTITKWTNPEYDGYPALQAMAQVAAALGVKLSEMVAAMEGEPPSLEIGSPEVRDWLRQEMDAWAEERGLQTGPRAAPE